MREHYDNLLKLTKLAVQEAYDRGVTESKPYQNDYVYPVYMHCNGGTIQCGIFASENAALDYCYNFVKNSVYNWEMRAAREGYSRWEGCDGRELVMQEEEIRS